MFVDVVVFPTSESFPAVSHPSAVRVFSGHVVIQLAGDKLVDVVDRRLL